jgi:hypothetical protein
MIASVFETLIISFFCSGGAMHGFDISTDMGARELRAVFERVFVSGNNKYCCVRALLLSNKPELEKLFVDFVNSKNKS